jgi:2'-5' RNA ligase
MIPGDRLLCLFVEDKRSGDTFSEWPLHLTLVPWFRTDVRSEDLGRKLRERLGKLKPFDVIIEGEANFGARRRLVSLVAEPTLLHTVEHEARDLLHEVGAWMVDETTKKRRQFRPHVTAQKSGRLHVGDSFSCGSIYIVGQLGGRKEIMEKITV